MGCGLDRNVQISECKDCPLSLHMHPSTSRSGGFAGPAVIRWGLVVGVRDNIYCQPRCGNLPVLSTLEINALAGYFTADLGPSTAWLREGVTVADLPEVEELEFATPEETYAVAQK
jgi:hypothetical protein